MTILDTSKTIHWNAQVHVGRGIVGVHAQHRAIVISSQAVGALTEAGEYNS